jgi:pyruvate dehydrogenase E2 component (dihydrolipoamide acetyltransferase)
MPSLGADMEAGTLVEWVKHPGDAVKRGDIIAVVDTQKGAIEIEVFEDGVLEKTIVELGQKVPVGTALAIIRGREVERPSGPEPVSPLRAAPVAMAPTATPPAAEPSPRGRISPMARKLAADLGIDLAVVTGTGAQGAITRVDVEHAAAALKGVAPMPSAPPMDRTMAMRTAIAAAMSRSKRDIPHYYLSTTIDLSAALTWLQSENERRAIAERLLPATLLIKAVALALREVPELNGYWTANGFRKGSGIHIGVAISLRGGGLVAPAIHDTDTLTLTTLMRQLQSLVARARAGSLKSSELTDPTITVTNLGEQGMESTFGIIYPPQVALVGFGRIVQRPWVVGGKVEIRPLVTTTLSGDHRATDGHRGGLLLSAIDRVLQTPEKL